MGIPLAATQPVGQSDDHQLSSDQRHESQWPDVVT